MEHFSNNLCPQGAVQSHQGGGWEVNASSGPVMGEGIGSPSIRLLLGLGPLFHGSKPEWCRSRTLDVYTSLNSVGE